MSTVAEPVDSPLASDPAPPAWRPTPGERVVIYGAGGFARSLLQTVRAAGAAVPWVLDRRGADIGVFEGVPVHRPGEDGLSPVHRAELTALVGVFNRDANPLEIESCLRSLGHERVVGVPELYESFGAELGPRFWLAERAFYAAHRGDIETVAEIWADSSSRELYRSLLRFRTQWDSSTLPHPLPGPQYFPPDVPNTVGPMRFVDCGAFVGDTLAAIAGLGAAVEEVYAFEPDISNFARLSRYASEFSSTTSARVSLWPCAVAAGSGVRAFRADGAEAGHLTLDGEHPVTAVALDDALPAAMVTDLKMDIEGAELEALRGAEALIRRAQPRLAICVYHRAEHLWEIPLFVRGLGLPYDLFLRSHGHFGFDVVMYAVPRAERSRVPMQRVMP